MKRTKIFLAVFALSGMFYNGQAQETKTEVKDSVTSDGTVRKTIKMEVKSAEDLQNLFKMLGNGNVQVTNKSADAQQKKGTVTTLNQVQGRLMESNGDKTLHAKSYLNRQAPVNLC